MSLAEQRRKFALECAIDIAKEVSIRGEKINWALVTADAKAFEEFLAGSAKGKRRKVK